MPDGLANAPRLRRSWKVVAAALAAVLVATTVSVVSVTTVLATSSTLSSGQSLSQNQYLLSPNGGFQLILQNDGNLVLYEACPTAPAGICYTRRALWSSGTADTRGVVLWMQGDGNLVLYDIPGGYSIWSSVTGNPAHHGYHVDVQDDGNTVLHDGSNNYGGWMTWTWNGQNTPALGDLNTGQPGDCWRNGTPEACVTTWAGKGQPVHFLTKSGTGFSSVSSNWRTDAVNAVAAWNNSPAFRGNVTDDWSTTSYSAANYIWLIDNKTTCSQGQYRCALANSNMSTVNCDANSNCALTDINEWFGEVYLNDARLKTIKLGSQDATDHEIQAIFAHEIGHAMMLDHNPVDQFSIMFPFSSPTVIGPTQNDIGAYPGCANGGYGTNCIYGYGD